MKITHPLARRRRARGALLVVLILLAYPAAFFFRAQVVRSSTYALRSEENRLRPVAVPAPRGTIYDRNGRVIADNVPGYRISVLPGRPDSIRAAIERIRPWVEVSDARIERLLTQARRFPREPVVVRQNASQEEVAALEARRNDLPGVFIEMWPVRRYHAPYAIAHVIGYVGEITSGDLAQERFADYEQGMIVGQAGIERQYEEILQGTAGVRYLEVDARGAIVGSFAGGLERPGEAGGDMRLNIDLELQEWIHRIWPHPLRGAVVALDPEDGGVLAMYSTPSYDPNRFVGGIPSELWQRLNADTLNPLLNRAVMGLYPPASTFKLATAAMALDLGVVTPEERMPVPCTGGMRYGNRYWRCWRPEGHGYQDLAGAIKHSCDVYFYQLGLRIGLETMLEQGQRLGLDNRCGIDLPQELPGTFPEGLGFWERRFGYRPNEGEVLSLSIGQGPNDQTPLRMAQLFVALARDGSAPAPRIYDGAPMAQSWELDLDSAEIAALQLGMREVVSPGGTAHYRAALEHWDMTGKTGTAENTLSKQELAEDHAWFVGIAGPWDREPEIVVAAIVEFGGGGSRVAAPIVAKASDFYLRRRYGMPIDTLQTLREVSEGIGWSAVQNWRNAF